MTARTFLVRGLVAGLLAGIAAFAVAYLIGVPQVDTAVQIEGASSSTTDPAADGPTLRADGVAQSGGGGGGDGVSRQVQSTWGLLTGNLAVGVALGGLVGLAAAAAVGRIGRLTPRQSTGLVALVGFAGFALVPFLKYPANPPSVGTAETVGERTALYFGFVAISLGAAVLAVLLARRVAATRGAYAGTLAGVAAYLLVVVVAGTMMPTINEVADFPADTLWYFRRASVLILATMWGVIGFGLAGLIGREHDKTVAQQRRRELATSL